MTETFTNTGLKDGPDPWAEEDPPTDGPLVDATPVMRPGLLPDEFWAARPAFKRIRQAAHSRGCSGDVLFYTTLSRTSGMLSHQVRAVTGIGKRASLNIFAAVVGVSGAGKSTGAAVSRELMVAVEGFPDGLPIGTGEGIAETFMGVVDEESGDLHQSGKNKGQPVILKVRKQVGHNAYFYVDEGQTLTQLAQRSASTLAETVRRAAVGEALGQTNASEDRKRFIAPDSYSMGMLVGFQPSTAIPLLADAGTGTPQRFLWGWAVDPSIPDDPPEWPGQWHGHVGLWRPEVPVDITFPEAIRKMLWREMLARNRGEVEVAELDGHAGLMKVKLAALFALLDEPRRTRVNDEDWLLAEMVWKSSCAVRDVLVIRAQREAEAARERENEARVEQELHIHGAKQGADLRLERVAQLIRKHACVPGGISRGALRPRIAKRDRDILDRAIVFAVAREWIIEEGDQLCAKID